MKTEFTTSFLQDIKKIKDKKLLKKVKETILTCEKVQSIQKIKNIKKLKGSKNFYSIRIGDYRIGLALELVFVRRLHRKEIYRFFPF
jgi:mRNA interferase RelE/StbE